MRSRFSQPNHAFTLIELLVSISIIGVLIALVTISVGRAMRTAKGTADRQTVVALSQGVQAFKQEFGFLPPLALHDEAGGIPPVSRWNPTATPNRYAANGTRFFINASGSELSWNYNDPANPFWPANYLNTQGRMNGNVYVPGYPEGFSQTVNGPNVSADFRSSDINAIQPDRRYSDYSLAYYLGGVLPATVDGVDGPGMWAPKTDGTFDGSITQQSRTGSRALAQQGKSYPPLVDTSRNSPKMVTDTSVVIGSPSFVTGYKLVSPSGKAYRYYRWKPQDSRDLHGSTQAPYMTWDAYGVAKQEDDFDRLRIPSLVGNPRENADLRSAEYAIVSCGPDGFFGDMRIEADSDADFGAMAGGLGIKPSGSTGLERTRLVREAARKDNIVEVGR